MKNTTRLSSSISLGVPSRRPGLTLPLLFVTVAMLLLLLSTASSTFADSATWKTSPATGDWNHAANWTPLTVPNGPSDTATFAASNTTGVSLSANTEVNGIVFNAGASPFTITVSTQPLFNLTISGVGITNNSGIAQNFAALGYGQIVFRNSATAGSGTFFGTIVFYDASTAGNGTFTNNDGTETAFANSATAGNGIFTVNGGPASGIFFGSVCFFDHSSAGNGIFTVNAGAASGALGGRVEFNDNSTAHAATIIANGGLGRGGLILFTNDARGGKSRVAVFGNGTLDISYQHSSGVTIGSLEGDGYVFLGDGNLTVGSNNLDTTFSGVIQESSPDFTSGSLTKIGRGKLVLRHQSTYPGGTTINRGKLIVNNIGGSGTGSGPVQVDGGWLGGKGMIAGAVTVGTGSGSGAVLAPGYVHGLGSPGALTIQSALTFSVDATYNVDVNSSNATADEVVADGVTINSGAQFSFADIGNGTLPNGTVFTIINNSSATPIAGTFSNLPDGSTFTSNGNTYQVNYEGGDGNDLTLTVVP
jgi:autotransporter-associated beta strand protein